MVDVEDLAIDVVVVTYNSSVYLPRLISSLRRAHKLGSVVIVDNASSDDSLRVAAQQELPCKPIIIENLKNIGFGAAMNQGVQALASDNEFVLLVNPDVQLEDTTITTLLAAVVPNRKIGCAGPNLRTSSGLPVSSARALPTPQSIALRKVVEQTTSAANGITEVGWICGAVMLWRKSVFLEVGGFSSEYFLYYEDVDICKKLHEVGFSVVTVPSAYAVHDQGHGEAPSPHLKSFSRASRRTYARKWLGTRGYLAARTAESMDALASLKSMPWKKL